MTSRILALDLEGTLISNAVSRIARPGLHAFLTQSDELFERVVIFTTVGEGLFREIAQLLVREGQAPAWFAELHYVQWTGPTKDLSFVEGAQPEDVLLVDDHRPYVHPGQEAQWVPVAQFEHPYSSADEGLSMTLECIRKRLGYEDCPGGSSCRPLGRMKGRMVVRADFDAPLLPEVLAAFEGAGNESEPASQPVRE